MTPQRSPAAAAAGGGGTPALHYLSGPYGDTTYTKVFVGGLAWETRSEGLRAHFEAYGEILEAVVITDRATGRSKGYGFVTFRDPDSARMACMDPYPVIDGRRANCNLAILGRPGPAMPFAPLRPVIPYNGGVAVPGGMYVQSPTYQQPPYNYPQAFVYPSYGPSTYGPEYMYPQNAYGSYVGQQYVPVYGGPRTVGPAVYPYGQFGQPVPGDQPYSPGYVPGHILPLSNQNAANVVRMSSTPSATALDPCSCTIHTKQHFGTNVLLIHGYLIHIKCECQAAPLEGAGRRESFEATLALLLSSVCAFPISCQEF
uniref:RRM domain-containing protein n=1 Tax=Oryza barthii TaxID=65489 RepID=A0A0D3GIS0_9ORYZ